MNDKDERKEKIRSACRLSVDRAAGRIRLLFNAQKRCLVHSWTELAQKSGLSAADIPSLREWVTQNGYQGPKR